MSSVNLTACSDTFHKTTALHHERLVVEMNGTLSGKLKTSVSPERHCDVRREKLTVLKAKWLCFHKDLFLSLSESQEC